MKLACDGRLREVLASYPNSYPQEMWIIQNTFPQLLSLSNILLQKATTSKLAAFSIVKAYDFAVTY